MRGWSYEFYIQHSVEGARVTKSEGEAEFQGKSVAAGEITFVLLSELPAVARGKP